MVRYFHARGRMLTTHQSSPEMVGRSQPTVLGAEAARPEVGAHWIDAPAGAVVQCGQVTGRFGHRSDPWLRVVGRVDDADGLARRWSGSRRCKSAAMALVNFITAGVMPEPPPHGRNP